MTVAERDSAAVIWRQDGLERPACSIDDVKRLLLHMDEYDMAQLIGPRARISIRAVELSWAVWTAGAADWEYISDVHTLAARLWRLVRLGSDKDGISAADACSAGGASE